MGKFSVRETMVDWIELRRTTEQKFNFQAYFEGSALVDRT